ncbi:MAG: M14 family metallopeptidase [Lachnospiraceae bacterium]|nr:M14 family metallopeptidase [Lachnospiraceae bacterium]
MVEKVVEMELPVGEKLSIIKNRILPDSCEKEYEETGMLSKKLPRIALVTGIHGDELEGQYVCYEIARRIREQKENLTGIVDVYPAINPLGIENAVRSIPTSDMDMNRNFPGDTEGDPTEQLAAAVVADIAGADFCLDVHASDIFVKEIPQVRVSEEFSERMLPYAELLNVDMIWMNATATVHESTLAHSMNLLGIPTMVVEMGLGGRINKSYGNQVVDGIFNLMKKLGIWKGEIAIMQHPVVSTDGEVEFIRAEHVGIFLPAIEHNHYVREGDLIGEIVNPVDGTVRERITASRGGLIFTLREYPVVTHGALLARILV